MGPQRGHHLASFRSLKISGSSETSVRCYFFDFFLNFKLIGLYID